MYAKSTNQAQTRKQSHGPNLHHTTMKLHFTSFTFHSPPFSAIYITLMPMNNAVANLVHAISAFSRPSRSHPAIAVANREMCLNNKRSPK